MIIWTQRCFVRGGGIENQHSIRSLSIGLNIFVKECRLSTLVVHPSSGVLKQVTIAKLGI